MCVCVEKERGGEVKGEEGRERKRKRGEREMRKKEGGDEMPLVVNERGTLTGWNF